MQLDSTGPLYWFWSLCIHQSPLLVEGIHISVKCVFHWLIVFRSSFTRQLPVPESLGTFGLLISKHEATEILPHPKAVPLDIVGEGYTCSENYLYQKEICPRYRFGKLICSHPLLKAYCHSHSP